LSRLDKRVEIPGGIEPQVGADLDNFMLQVRQSFAGGF
jgi:hypothetical protein